jgi:hypothetical protein
MSTDPRKADLSPLANAYLLSGLGAIALLGFVLVQAGGRWGLFPALVGAAGLAFRWRPAPLVVLAGIALGQLGPHGPVGDFGLDTSMILPRQSFLPNELPMLVAVCALTLAYVASHYRLIGLTAGPFPPGPRKTDAPPPRRDGAAVSTELVNGLFTIATATVGAFFIWRVVASVPPPWDTAPLHWQVGLLAWLLIGAWALAAAVISHLGWRRLSRAEAAVFLQDALWHETRREQRRINRWRAWAVRRR